MKDFLKIYTGIGSRETPKQILELFRTVGEYLAKEGFTLRSGAAGGADAAFETGCDKAQGLKEIFIPWQNFNNRSNRQPPDYVASKKEAFQLAEKFHKRWDTLSDAGKKYHARNAHQVLGWDFDKPTSFIICYTHGGKGKGGTGLALRIARQRRIPIFDAGRYSNKNNAELFEMVKEFVNKTVKKRINHQ
jgi:hypothetical protein